MKLDIGVHGKDIITFDGNRTTLVNRQCDSDRVSFRQAPMSECHKKKVNLFLRTYKIAQVATQERGVSKQHPLNAIV